MKGRNISVFEEQIQNRYSFGCDLFVFGQIDLFELSVFVVFLQVFVEDLARLVIEVAVGEMEMLDGNAHIADGLEQHPQALIRYVLVAADAEVVEVADVVVVPLGAGLEGNTDVSDVEVGHVVVAQIQRTNQTVWRCQNVLDESQDVRIRILLEIELL